MSGFELDQNRHEVDENEAAKSTHIRHYRSHIWIDNADSGDCDYDDDIEKPKAASSSSLVNPNESEKLCPGDGEEQREH